MRATMTSSSIVPSKFYQVCRLCLTVVNDTSDLLNLSVFGRHDATCMDKTANAQPTGDSVCVPVSTSTQNSGVIVKAQCVKSMSRKSSINNDCSGERDDDQHSVGDGGNGSDNEVTSADDTVDDDERTIFNNNNNLQQSEILERIYTFLSITVSVYTHQPFFLFLFHFIFFLLMFLMSFYFCIVMSIIIFHSYPFFEEIFLHIFLFTIHLLTSRFVIYFYILCVTFRIIQARNGCSLSIEFHIFSRCRAKICSF